MAAFCRPFTTAAIRYFDRADADHAHRWVAREDLAASRQDQPGRGHRPGPAVRPTRGPGAHG
jgi:hypothetical protein